MHKTALPFYLLLTSLAFSLVLTSTIEAHFLATDGSIGAVLHVDPNDSPVAGQTATFFFDLKDKAGKFQPSQCTCSVVVKENGNQIDSEPLPQGNLSIPSFSYVFARKDVYQVRLVGSPVQPGGFQPFVLSWDIRVDQDGGGMATSLNLTALVQFLQNHISALFLILLVIVGTVYPLVRKRKNRKER